MDLIKIIGVAILICIASIVIKQIKPEFSLIIIIAGSCLILWYILQYIDTIINVFDNIAKQTNINTEFLTIILKIVGIGYLIEFAANICVDSGNSSIADKIILIGKLIILTVSMPIISNLLNVIVGLIQ